MSLSHSYSSDYVESIRHVDETLKTQDTGPFPDRVAVGGVEGRVGTSRTKSCGSVSPKVLKIRVLKNSC